MTDIKPAAATAWERPTYTARQVAAIASGRLDPTKLNAQLRNGGRGLR